MSQQAIICVDDERVVLISLRDQLTNHLGIDYEIELAETGEEALEIFDELQLEGNRDSCDYCRSNYARNERR